MKTKNQSLYHTFIYSFAFIVILSSGVPFYFWVNYLIVDMHEHSRQIRKDYIKSQKTLLKNQVDIIVQGAELSKANAEKKLKQEIKERVYEAYETCVLIYTNNIKRVSKAKLYELIHDALWYREWDGGNGYIFAEYLNGVEYINRNNPELEGENIIDLKDDRGTFLVREILGVAVDSGEGYCSYYWNVPGKPGVLTKKISFVKLFKPLGIVIGSGKYLIHMENEIKKDVIERISNISLDDNGYAFAGQWDGLSLSGPSTGKNMLHITDPNGVKIVEKLIDVSKSGGGYVEYVMPKFENHRPSPKLSYADGIEDWQWYIGAGKYVDIIEEVINHNESEKHSFIYRAIIKVIILYIFILLAGIIGLKWFSRKINTNISTFIDAFKNVEIGKGTIDIEKVFFSEFYEIAESANRMFERQIQSDKALAESEKNLSEVIENAHIPIMIVNSKNKIEYINSEFIKFFGYTLDDIPSMKEWWKKAYNNDLQEKDAYCLLKSVSGGNINKNELSLRQMTITCKDPLKLKSVEISSSIIGNRRLFTLIDMTERIKTEKEKELLEQRKHRSQKMEAIGLMAGGVAHDLNNILSGIVGFPEMILLDMSKSNPLYRPIEIIYESALRASAVVDDLLTVARGVASKKDVCDLNILVKDFLASPECIKMQSYHKYIEIIEYFDPDLIPVKCSSVHIKKVIMNLVSNALEAIDTSGIINISTESIYLDRPVQGYTNISIGEYSVISISDNGSGISKDDLERIFEPFYSKKVMGRSGTGLGLSIVWNTINDHNGYIDIKTSKEGTTFKIYLPSTRESIQSEEEETNIIDLVGNNEKVLVIDDEPNQRTLSSVLLKRLNYQVETVSSGEEAIEYLKNKNADILLLDMVMDPGMNGYETYQIIKKKIPDQKAIVASGFARTKDVENTIKLGAGDYIKKPYTIRALGLALNKVINS